MSEQGNKNDDNKTRFDLLEPDFINEVAKVMTHGAHKYGPENWKKVGNAKARYMAALLRHINAWQQGERNDPETGMHHLAHATCNLMFLFYGDINETTDIQRREGNAASFYEAAWRVDAGRDEAYNDETDYCSLRADFERLLAILAQCPTHQSARARINDIFIRRSESELLSTDNET